MNIFEFTIIYLALGAPFGVYYAATHAGEATSSLLLAGIANIVFWPFYGVFVAYVRFSNPPEADRELAIEAICKQIKPEIPHRSHDILNRYAHLALAFDEPVGAPGIDGLTAAGLVPDSHTAQRCSSRSNRARIEMHVARARSEVVEFLRTDARFAGPVVQLAEVAGDHIGKELFATVGPPSLSLDNNGLSVAA